MNTAHDSEQPDGEPVTGWTDPRYADMVAGYYAARLRGEPPRRGFLYELPEDRRPG